MTALQAVAEAIALWDYKTAAGEVPDSDESIVLPPHVEIAARVIVLSQKPTLDVLDEIASHHRPKQSWSESEQDFRTICNYDKTAWPCLHRGILDRLNAEGVAA